MELLKMTGIVFKPQNEHLNEFASEEKEFFQYHSIEKQRRLAVKRSE